MRQHRAVLELPRAGMITVARLLSACAGSTGSYRATVAPVPALSAASYDFLEVAVEADEGIRITDAERERIGSRIGWYLEEDCPAAPALAKDGTADLRAHVRLTRYEGGNALARAILAGLGQIHIDAQLELTEGKTGELLGRYDISKTFAWGGIYGGITRLEDVEHGFARAVVAAICEAVGGTPRAALRPDRGARSAAARHEPALHRGHATRATVRVSDARPHAAGRARG